MNFNLNLYERSEAYFVDRKFKVMKKYDRLWIKSSEPFNMVDSCDNLDIDYGDDLRSRSYFRKSDFLIKTVKDIIVRGAASYEFEIANNGRLNRNNSIIYPLSSYNTERGKDEEFKRILGRLQR